MEANISSIESTSEPQKAIKRSKMAVGARAAKETRVQYASQEAQERYKRRQAEKAPEGHQESVTLSQHLT